MEYILLGLFSLAVFIFIIKSHYHWTYFFAINLFVCFFSLMLALTGQWQRALNFASVLYVVLMLFHRLKIHYYKQPLLMSDFIVAFDWRNWSTLWQYKASLFAVLGLLGLLGYAVFGWSHVASFGMTSHLIGAGLTVLTIALMWHYSKDPHVLSVWLDSLPHDGDVFFNLPMSCRGVFFKVPQFEGDSAYFQQKAAALSPYAKREDKPDIVVWLLESTLNPHYFDIQSAPLPPIKMFEKQPDTAYYSPLRVHTFGGATWKSEFAFLAGVPATDFGSSSNAVFYSVAPHLQCSLLKSLKRQGYYCVALTPCTKGNYNANVAYEALGFDLILQPQELGYPAAITTNLWDIPSAELAVYVKKVLQKQGIPSLEHIDKPLFVYTLTMKEHGPYKADVEDKFQLKDNGFNSASTSALNDYIQRMAELSAAIEDFNQFMQTRNRPYVLGYFGDHQVEMLGRNIPKKWDYDQPDYVTQAAVRTNLSGYVPQQEFMDLALFGGLLMEIAGLEADEFMQANIAMRRLTQGKLQDCEDKTLLAGYRNYLYHQLNIAGN
ncbi:LTA synthase family protein [Pasteurellaceae bacterium LIM206]|nr:LTA synthase family protein [Pasteurellaceae bacterium LIM206]